MRFSYTTTFFSRTTNSFFKACIPLKEKSEVRHILLFGLIECPKLLNKCSLLVPISVTRFTDTVYIP